MAAKEAVAEQAEKAAAETLAEKKTGEALRKWKL